MIKMKKILAGLTAFTMLCGIACVDNSVIYEITNTVSVSAEELTLDNDLKYEINEEGTEIIITGCDQNAVEIEIPAEIDGLPVTSIGFRAFANCASLVSLIIPDSVTWISRDAFKDCTSLTDITIPNSVTMIFSSAFYGCTSLTEIKIPDSIKYVEDRLFENCTSLTEVTISDSVTGIGYNVFSNTAILNNQSTDLKYIDGWLVQCDNKEIEKAEIKEGTRGIASIVFDNCTSLTEVVIPDSVTSIGGNAFRGTPFLNNQTTDVKYAGKCVINCNHNITDVEIKPDTVGIATSAFIDCTSLKEVTIPDSVLSIGIHALGYYFENFVATKLDGFTIYGVKGSAAENYAIENGFNFIEIGSEPTEKTGDIDSDGEVTSSDALNLLQAVVGSANLTDEQKKIADLDGDGEITSSDALVLLQMVVGII